MAIEFDTIQKETALLDDAAYWRARAVSATGDHADAARALARSIEAFGESPLRPRMMYDLGAAFNEMNENAEARTAFVAFREAYPEHRLAPDALHAEAGRCQRGPQSFDGERLDDRFNAFHRNGGIELRRHTD